MRQNEELYQALWEGLKQSLSLKQFDAMVAGKEEESEMIESILFEMESTEEMLIGELKAQSLQNILLEVSNCG